MTCKTAIVMSFIMPSFLLQGCLGIKKENIPTPRPVTVTPGPVHSHSDCTCDDSFPFYAANMDPDRQQAFTPHLTEEDKNTGTKTHTDLPALIIAPNDKQLFLGCSAGPTTGIKKCLMKKNYSIKNYTALRSTSGAMTAVFGPTFSSNISSCAAACSNPNNPYCYDLGKASELVIPFSQLIDGAWAPANGVIHKKDVLAKYKITEAEDKCDRGDTVITNGIATNASRSGAGCKISVRNGFDPTSSVTGVDLYIAPELVAQKIPGTRAPNSSIRDIELSDVKTGAVLEFVGVGSVPLNEDFAGQIRYITDETSRLILSTSRGCLVVPK